MNVIISMDYISSQWRVVYTEDEKVCLCGEGATLKDALLALKDLNVVRQIILWYGMNPQSIGLWNEYKGIPQR